jgi:hypothetical protein
MESFLTKHRDKILGTIVCFDRVLFKGYLPLSWPEGMERFMQMNGLLIKEFKQFVQLGSDQLKEHAEGMARRFNRPLEYLCGRVDKEEKARRMAMRDGITEGLVCVFSAVEACQSFKLEYGKGRPRVVGARRKCLCLYFYFLDRELGFLHIRIQTWFPFTVQVCLNGHEWLARKLDRHGIAYEKLDNAFLSISDPARAQRFADRFVEKKWPRVLSALARKVNPLMGQLLREMDYYWVTDQAECATDVMFRSRATLKALYENLLRHATLCFGAEDVMTFLGRKLHGGFAGEILSDCKQRWPGARIKHRMKENWIKMYDKFGRVLRIETVINNPYEFKVRREGKRQGQVVKGWFPMAKGVANLYRYDEVSRAANSRYLQALAVVEDPASAQAGLRKLSQPVRQGVRSYRGFNPAAAEDIHLFAAVCRGEHAIQGFRNRDIRGRLFPAPKRPPDARSQSARISRLFKRLHVHGFIAKIPRSRRWRLTNTGLALMTMALTLHHKEYPELLLDQAV